MYDLCKHAAVPGMFPREHVKEHTNTHTCAVCAAFEDILTLYNSSVQPEPDLGQSLTSRQASLVARPHAPDDTATAACVKVGRTQAAQLCVQPPPRGVRLDA